MTDIDGTSTLSDIARINSAHHGSPLSIYPNPARYFVTVGHPATANDARLKMLDMNGKLIQQVTVNKNSLQTKLNIAGLAPGTYKIIWSDGVKTLDQTMLIMP
jgi:hypothetical protein